ncbi:WD40/YVTN/BNR-like repeat-containing protein [Ideonella sp.]|uniref:WD40/YVTN/BNR-like repeat-containing protein n=1 Tax=Ideonella sp. TaxID=1929293 RepID=UPI002B497A58|nr:YCF48-related protein [Ideonella sp.]HJV70463.1 YCF48-related protein [Ideonella sp.]
MRLSTFALRRLAACTLAALPALSAATPTGPALERAALAVRAPDRAVLVGAALAGERIVAVGERGIVALSDDGAHHWRQASVPTSVTLTAVRFADAKQGWAVGHGGTVLASDDGGERWSRRLDGRQAAQAVLDAARTGGDARAVQEAERLLADGPDKPLLDLLLLGGQRLLVVGAYGLALASEDGGSTWQSWMPRLPNPKGLHLYAARQRGQTLLLAGEQGLVLLSTDAGHSFRRVDTPYKGSFFSAELLGEQDIVLAGLRGTTLRSTDGGANWTSVAVPMPASITATAIAPDGRLLAANQAGFVMALQGDHMVPLNTRPLPPLNGLLPRAGAPLLALTVQGAQRAETEPERSK